MRSSILTFVAASLVVGCAADGRPSAEPEVVPTPTVGGPGGGAVIVEGDTVEPDWSLDHLSADGRTVAIRVEEPCGARYGDALPSVLENDREVRIRIEVVVERAPDGTECYQVPAAAGVPLAEPLGDRRVIDGSVPDRELSWNVPPGGVRAGARIVVEPGAIAPELDGEYYLALGFDEPQVPISLDQLPRGEGAVPGTVVLAPGDHYGVVGLLDSLPLVPRAVREEARALLPPWEPGDVDQVLVVTLRPGLLGGSGREATIDSSRIAVAWEQRDR